MGRDGAGRRLALEARHAQLNRVREVPLKHHADGLVLTTRSNASQREYQHERLSLEKQLRKCYEGKTQSASREHRQQLNSRPDSGQSSASPDVAHVMSQWPKKDRFIDRPGGERRWLGPASAWATDG